MLQNSKHFSYDYDSRFRGHEHEAFKVSWGLGCVPSQSFILIVWHGSGGCNTLDVENAKGQVHVLNRQVTSTFQAVLASWGVFQNSWNLFWYSDLFISQYFGIVSFSRTGNKGGCSSVDIGVQSGTPQLSVQLSTLGKSYPHSAAWNKFKSRVCLPGWCSCWNKQYVTLIILISGKGWLCCSQKFCFVFQRGVCCGRWGERLPVETQKEVAVFL